MTTYIHKMVPLVSTWVNVYNFYKTMLDDVADQNKTSMQE